MILVGFSTRRKNLLSRLIRWGTNSEFSHTFLSYDHDLYKTSIVVEASLRGIIEMAFTKFIASADTVLMLSPPEGTKLEKGMPAIASTLGDGYDGLSLFGRVFVIVAKWFGKKIRNPLGNVKRDCCVESVIRCLVEAEALPPIIDAEVESPQSLYEILKALGWSEVVKVGFSKAS